MRMGPGKHLKGWLLYVNNGFKFLTLDPGRVLMDGLVKPEEVRVP